MHLKTASVTALAIGGLIALAGCSSPAPAPAAHTRTPTPTPTVVQVSLERTCQQLFIGDGGGAAGRAENIVERLAEHPDGSTINPSEPAKSVAELTAIEATAIPEVRPDIEKMIAPIQQLDDAFTSGVNSTITVQDVVIHKAVLADTCSKYV